MNSKNNSAMENLCLAYLVGNKSAYSLSAKEMDKYMSTQYPNKISCHQCQGKNGDRNRKKGDDHKLEDTDDNAIDTATSHIGDVTAPEDSTASSHGSNSAAHVSEVSEEPSWPM